MSVPASSAEATPPPRRAVPKPTMVGEFKITPTAAARVERALRRRVLGHRTTAAVLMLAALVAIGGGITLIFYAGELATQQRAADVGSLVERANELSKKADDVRRTADQRIAQITGAKSNLTYYTQQEIALKQNLTDEKDPVQKKAIQDQINQNTNVISSLNDTSKNANSLLKNAEKTRDSALGPIIENEKQINQQITGSSAVLEYNSILIRVAAVLLIVFLVQTFITIFRYMTRLAAYYQARVDALQLATGVDIGIGDLQKITTVFSPETYDFGKLPRTPTEQAVDLARTIIASQRKEE